MTTKTGKWVPTSSRFPAEGTMVETKIDKGGVVRNVARLRYHSNLWWTGDMYVYYRPTHWRPVRAKA